MTVRGGGGAAPSGRPRRRRLSHDGIIATGMRIGSDDLGAVSLRRLAEKSGVTPMASYRRRGGP